MENELWLSTLGITAFNIVRAIEQGFLNKITFEEIHREIESGQLIAFLEEKLKTVDLDFSVLKSDNGQGRAFIEVMQRIANATTGSDFGVEKCGLCLLLALCIEAMKSRDWNWEWEAEKRVR
jgi:hypothetical protein